MGLFGGLGKAVGGLIGGHKNKKAAKAYGKKAEFNPYNINTPYGSVKFDKATNSVSGQLSPLQQALQGYLTSSGMGLMGQMGNFAGNGGVNPAMQGAMNNYDQNNFLGPLSGLYANQVQTALSGNTPYKLQQDQFGQAASGMLGALGSFDPRAAADRYTANLRQQAMPGQQRAVNSTVQNLFNTGRLGSSGGADIMGQLAQAQDQQDLGFQQAGMDYSGAEQQRLTNQAMGLGQQSGMFGQLGDQFRQNAFSNSSALGGQLDNRTNQRFANAMNMFGVGNQRAAIGQGFGQLGSGLIGQAQGIDQNLLSMIGLGGQLGSADSSADAVAWQPLLGAKQQANKVYSQIGGAIGKGADAYFGSWI